MKKIILVLFITIILITGCSSNKGTLPQLVIMGDVVKAIELDELWFGSDLVKHKVEYGDKKIDAVNTQELLTNISTIYNDNCVYFKANDGFMIKLDGDTLQDSYIGYSREHKWVFISEDHPVNSRIKNITEIIIVNNSDETDYKHGLNIVVGDKNVHYSMGELLTSKYTVQAFSDGISSKEVDGKRYSVDVMQQRKVVALESLIDERIASTLVMTRDGEYEYNVSETELFEIARDGINYITQDKTYRDIVGIMINPPQKTVMDTYYDTIHYLEQDTDVMVVFIDGFSYFQYEYIKENRKQLFLSNINKVSKANTVFKPVTNAGFAAMITGKPPHINGVLNRQYRELKVTTIFDMASELGKKSILIEGDINILNTSIKPQLNLDKNKNGTKDDEIYHNALTEIGNGYNLFFVHFHSVDEFGHSYGDLDKNTIDNIAVIDGYVEDLVAKWHGKVIIVSDHGMHKTRDGGSHGEFRAEDLYIPYFVLDGGRVDEKQ